LLISVTTKKKITIAMEPQTMFTIISLMQMTVYIKLYGITEDHDTDHVITYQTW
jgi:hypothetical protein